MPELGKSHRNPPNINQEQGSILVEYLGKFSLAIQLGIFFILILFLTNICYAGTLITLSSHTYNTTKCNEAEGVGIDSLGNIFVAGHSYTYGDLSSRNMEIVKYDSSLNFINFDEYDSGVVEWGFDVGVAENGDILVTGGKPNTSLNFDYFTLRYKNDLSSILKEELYDAAGGFDHARAIAVDKDGNIFITGRIERQPYTGDDCHIVKYNKDLVVISSATYNYTGDNEDDSGLALAFDNDGNVIVAGFTMQDCDKDMLIIKYSNDLENVLAIAPNDKVWNGCDYIDQFAYGVAVDRDGNIIVVGSKKNGAGYDWSIVKLNTDLDDILFETTFSADVSKEDEAARGIVIDSNGDMIITGSYDTGPGGAEDYLTIRYDPYFNIVASHTYNGASSLGDFATDIVLDNLGNMVVTGRSEAVSDSAFFTIKYLGAPLIYSISPSSAKQGETVEITIEGANFYPGVEAEFSGTGILVSSVTVSSTTLVGTVTISNNAPGGKRDLSVTNIDGVRGVYNNAFVVKFPSLPSIKSVSPSSGTQGETLDIEVKGANFYSGVSVDLGEGIGINSISVASKELIEVNITIGDNAACGNRDLKVVNVDEGSATKTDAFEVKERVEEGEGMERFLAGGDGEVKIQGGREGYVNPDKNEVAIIHFNTTGSGNVDFNIYTVRGELVWKRSKDTDGNPDLVRWNCRNSNGTTVSSGVYILIVKGPGLDCKKYIPVVR